MSGNRNLLERASDDIQTELDTMMAILEDNQDKISEGEYLRGMNALGSLHKQKRTVLANRRPGDMLRCWMTLDEIEEMDEDLYDEIMDVADDIVVELCGDEASIYMHDHHNLVHRGEEREIFQLLKSPIKSLQQLEHAPMARCLVDQLDFQILSLWEWANR